MRYWWVNQNQTYKSEVPGGYLWSPKVKSNGQRSRSYDNMREVRPGDLVFCFADTYIKAVGTVTAQATTAPKPTEFGSVGDQWTDVGWYVEAAFEELGTGAFRPKDHMETLGPLLPPSYSPLQPNGNGNQWLYLAELEEPLALALGRLIGSEFSAIHRAAMAQVEDEAAQRALQARTDIDETERLQLIKARRGQGLFRTRVELIEPRCRLTGVSDRAHLRASHIKPWRLASDQEKLDGHNGLLLSPHVDHLFDRGFMSFEDGGAPLFSPRLPVDVREAWRLSVPPLVKPFTPVQAEYLQFHRDRIFRG